MLVQRYASPEDIYYAILNEGLSAFNLSQGGIRQVERGNCVFATLAIGGNISTKKIFELKNIDYQRVFNEKETISIDHVDPHFRVSDEIRGGTVF